MQAWPEGLAGIELKVNGFSHKLPLLLEQLVRALVTLKVWSIPLCADVALTYTALSVYPSAIHVYLFVWAI